jgi:hypothetical protein
LPGAQAVPFQNSPAPVAGAVAETLRPWSCVALPDDGVLMEKNGMVSYP